MESEKLILSEIRTLKEFFERGFVDNKNEHEKIQKTLKEFYEDHEKRVRQLEDWRLVFVTKYTVYSAIALFLGSITATIGYKLLDNYI